ncbi:MAG TPA: heavy metal translocating P-type ATPase [Rhabdochlamydiaceae bacterium]|nr:heavy metal translocating P-type ATPase [Rhabdochlamydiaceae bacterium]
MFERLASRPYIFDEFFASGREETISPFLTPSSRKWGRNLSLRTGILSAILLALSFCTSFFYPSLSHLLLAFVYLLAGTPALIDAIEDIKNLEINIDVLMTVAALLSVLIGSGMEGALLLVLFELSHAMEQTVMQKTRGALLHLNQLAPRTALVVKDGSVYEQSVKEIHVGAKLLIKTGEIVPLDGKIIEGESFVNLVHLTGETNPVSKQIGDEVPAGARVIDGYLTILVTKTSRDSTLSKIIQLITQAQEAKPKLERFLDTFGKWYASSIIFLSIAFAFILPFVFSIEYFGINGSVYRALTFLIAASPCALVIATPTAYLSAISCCARKGIILKGGIILDALAKCRLVAFDKTGTLTTGKLSCTSIETVSTRESICDVQTAVGIAASLEKFAAHPIAEAICDYAAKMESPHTPIDHFKTIPGSGLEGYALLNGQNVPVFIGHPTFISSKMSPTLASEWEQIKGSIEKPGHLNSILLIEDSIFVFHFIDSLRHQIIEAIEHLREKEKMRLMILTGDHSETAQIVANQLGIKEVFANLRPEDKLEKVSQFSQEGLIMVGDGINDAPALARATVGISMGKIGSATAVDASDVVFLQDELPLLGWLKNKSNQTAKIVKQNLFLAMGVIVFATTPALLGWVPLWAAVLLHEGGTVLVGLNSLRLLRK